MKIKSTPTKYQKPKAGMSEDGANFTSSDGYFAYKVGESYFVSTVDMGIIGHEIKYEVSRNDFNYICENDPKFSDLQTIFDRSRNLSDK